MARSVISVIRLEAFWQKFGIAQSNCSQFEGKYHIINSLLKDNSGATNTVHIEKNHPKEKHTSREQSWHLTLPP
jgi:hypothetical protein